MKAILLTALISMFGSNAFAGEAMNTLPFIGKYRAVEGDCLKHASPYRAYVGYDSKIHTLTLREFPNGDASMRDFALKSHTVSPSPGTSPEIHGKTSVNYQVYPSNEGKVITILSTYFRDDVQTDSSKVVLDASDINYLIITDNDAVTCKYERVRNAR